MIRIKLFHISCTDSPLIVVRGHSRYPTYDRGASYLLFLRCSGMCTSCDPISVFLYVSEEDILDSLPMPGPHATRVARLRNRQATTVTKVSSGRQTGRA